MTEEKDVHFTKKKIDEEWKKNIETEKGKGENVREERKSQKETEKREAKAEKNKGENTGGKAPKMNMTFGIFLSSLGLQALMHLGLIEHPETKKKEKNLDAARQTIDLLTLLKEKTKGNRTPDEDKMLDELLADLQIKYVETSSK